MMKKSRCCIVCGAQLMEEPIYKCINMPSEAQKLPTVETLINDNAIDIDLCQCSGCGLVQFSCDPVTYYKDSTRAGERCEALINLRKEQYKYLIETYHLFGKKILEVGAGKGGFLKTLKEMTEYNVKEFGIENNPEYVEIGRKIEGVNIQQGDAENSSTQISGAPFDAFVTFAYPARLIDPNSMMQFIRNNIVDDSVGLIQVPSFEHLLQPGGFYDITRDHIAYYTKDTLRFMLQKNGFDILEQGEVAKTYIYSIVRKRKPYNLREIWSDVEPLAEQVRQFARICTSGGQKLAIWCAGHFAFTVLSISGIGNHVSYIIDNSDLKKGHYSPATHVPIVGPEHFKEEPVETILILGPIYIDEIAKEIKAKCSQSVRIATMDRDGLREIL